MAQQQYDFTALILLSATSQPGVEEALLSVLQPFTLEIREVQKITLRGRLIIGILIACDPAHVLAIEEDINAFSLSTGMDVAMDFSEAGA